VSGRRRGCDIETVPPLALEVRDGAFVGLEIDHAVYHEADHQALGKHPGAAEHASHLDRSEAGKKLCDPLEILGQADPLQRFKPAIKSG
jgi:hypothetical protein